MLNKTDWALASEMMEAAQKGIFLTTKNQKVNTMILGWCQFGIMWAKPVIMVPVRTSRFSYEQMHMGGNFTLTAPSADMKKAVAFCGTESGRDYPNKLAEAGLRPKTAQIVDTPVIDGGILHAECKILANLPLDEEHMLPEVYDSCYSKTPEFKDNFHTLFFGELLTIYRNESIKS